MRKLIGAVLLVVALISSCHHGPPPVPLDGKEVVGHPQAADALVAKGKDSVPQVIDLMQRGDLMEAMACAGILARIGEPSVKPLRAYVKDGEKKNRAWACWALGEIGPAAKDALPALKSAQKEVALRTVAAEAVGKIEKR